VALEARHLHGSYIGTRQQAAEQKLPVLKAGALYNHAGLGVSRYYRSARNDSSGIVSDHPADGTRALRPYANRAQQQKRHSYDETLSPHTSSFAKFFSEYCTAHVVAGFSPRLVSLKLFQSGASITRG